MGKLAKNISILLAVSFISAGSALLYAQRQIDGGVAFAVAKGCKAATDAEFKFSPEAAKYYSKLIVCESCAVFPVTKLF